MQMKMQMVEQQLQQQQQPACVVSSSLITIIISSASRSHIYIHAQPDPSCVQPTSACNSDHSSSELNDTYRTLEPTRS